MVGQGAPRRLAGRVKASTVVSDVAVGFDQRPRSRRASPRCPRARARTAPILAPASEDWPNASRRAFASWKRSRSSSRSSMMRSVRALATAASAVSLASRSTFLAARSARIIACAAARSFGSDSEGVFTQQENHGLRSRWEPPRALCTATLTTIQRRCGRHVFCGARQSIPSSR